MTNKHSTPFIGQLCQELSANCQVPSAWYSLQKAAPHGRLGWGVSNEGSAGKYIYTYIVPKPLPNLNPTEPPNVPQDPYEAMEDPYEAMEALDSAKRQVAGHSQVRQIPPAVHKQVEEVLFHCMWWIHCFCRRMRFFILYFFCS